MSMTEFDPHIFFYSYIAVLNAHDFDRLDTFLHHELTVNGDVLSRDQLIAELKGHGEAVPDLTWQVQNLAIDGNQVAACFRNSGTPVKEWLGAKPTGAKVQYIEHVFHMHRGGRFYQLNFLLDAWSIQKQLGPT